MKTTIILLSLMSTIAASQTSSTWTQGAVLRASTPGASDFFGRSVAVSGTTMVVGAAYDDGPTNGASNSGAVYVYTWTASAWVEQAILRASNAGADDWFGHSVAISGDTIVVGSPLEDSSATGVNGAQANNLADGSGAAYVFVRSGATWTQQAYLKASNTLGSTLFGWSVAASGDTVAVGSFYECSGATGINGDQWNYYAYGSGAVYVFARTGTTWSQQAYVKASNTGSNDAFGCSIGLDADTLVVGACQEASSANTVNGVQLDDSAYLAGAAYVFARSGTTWSQQAYLKASNGEESDQFGSGVAVSGDTVVVGAPGQSSGTGAAYVFARSGTTWTQQAYLKSPVPDAPVSFGLSVAASGDQIVVGAFSQSSEAHLFVRLGTTWDRGPLLEPSEPTPGSAFGFSVAIDGGQVCVGASEDDKTGINCGAAYAFAREVPPNGPVFPGQADATGAALAAGASIHADGFTATAGVSDPIYPRVRLEAEVKPAGVAFDGATGLSSGAEVPTNTMASVQVRGLTLGDYHWRVRAVNIHGSVSAWKSFGTGGVDIRLVDQVPVAGAASQRRANGSPWAIGTAHLESDAAIRFESSGVDPEHDAIFLQVEVRPVGIAFTGKPTFEGPLAASGGGVACGGEAAHGRFHWQSRVGDSMRGFSAWSSFGGNAESEADFVVSSEGSVNTTSCLGSARGGIWLVALLLGFGVSRRRG